MTVTLDMELVEKPAAILEGNCESDNDGSSSDESASEQTDSIFDIARILASNTLKERNVGYKKMEKLLFDESEFSLDNEAALKIWKGLFFMIWHSDGFMRQELLGIVLSTESGPSQSIWLKFIPISIHTDFCEVII